MVPFLVLALAASSSFSISPPAGLIPIGDIDSATLPGVQQKFDDRVAAGDKTIMFRLNSFGGEVYAGWDFIQHVEDAKRAKKLHIQCVVDSRAMSMGAVFLETFCDERLMTRRAVLMFHGAASGAQGKEDDIKSVLSEMEAMDAAIASTCAGRMGMPVVEYRAHTDHLNWFLSADEALAAHAVDGLVDVSALPPPVETDDGGVAGLLKKLLGR